MEPLDVAASFARGEPARTHIPGDTIKRQQLEVQGVGGFTLESLGWAMSFVAVEGSAKDSASGVCA